MPLHKEVIEKVILSGHIALPGALKDEHPTKSALENISKHLSSTLQGIYRAVGSKQGLNKPTDQADAGRTNGKFNK